MDFSSIVDLIICSTICLLGIVINVKYLKDMKEEERSLGANSNGLLIRRVMTTYTITLIVSVPIQLSLSCFLYVKDENLELPTWFQYSMCYRIYLGQGLRIYHGFNSLVVAAMRYCFVVHRNDILRFGMEKAKSLFYYGSLATPIMIEILVAFTFPKLNFFNAAMSLCKESYQDSHNRIDLNVTITQGFSLPVYSFAHRYISSDITYYVRIFVFLLIAIIFSNVVEGILYYKTFAHITR